MHTQDTAVLARVIPLEHKRRARKVSRRSSVMKSSGLRGIVALWFGILIVGAASLLAAVTTVALRAGAVGTAGLIALGAAAAWPLAGRWVKGWRPNLRAPQRAPRRSA